MICKTNLVLLTDCLADLAGGAEKQIYELARGLDKNKYNVFVVSLDCWGKAPRELIESTGCRLDIFRVVRIYGISGLVQGLRFFQFLRKNQIKIILTYHFSSDIWGTFWGHLAGVPHIMSNRRDMGFWRNKWHIKAYRLVNHWVQRIIVNAGSIKQMVIDTEGVMPQRIDIIYNGVDLPEAGAAAGLDLKPEDRVIMHVANLKPVKGHRYLIEAFAGVKAQFPETKLILIGKDELNGEIQKMAANLDLQNDVLFLGKREDIPKLLPMADICVLPSLSEGMSNSIMEYMAAAKPVVATGVGGNPELVRNGFNGILVEKENVPQLKEALLTLLKNKEDGRIMGQNGLVRIKNEFSMGAMLARYDDLFSNLTGSKKLKVLHLVSSGGLFGAERVILNITAKSKQVDCVVGALFNRHNPHLEVIDEATRLGLKNVFFESQGRFDFHTIGKVKDFLAVNGIDILHTHNYKADIVGFWASLWAGKKWIATNHVWHSTDNKLKMYESIDALLLKFAQKVVSVSNEIKNDLLKKGFKESRLQVIDNGIPIENFSFKQPVDQIRSSLGIKPDDCAVLIAGRLAPEKGHEVFLQAAAKTVETAANIKFIIAGDGPLNESLRQRSRDLHLSALVVFTGIRNDMPQLYASCDMMVNASFIEGLPMTILEAMASRLPVIATKVGAVGEVIKDQLNGRLLEPGNAQTLAEAIIELASDKQKRQSLANNAYRDVCEHFSDQRMADQYQKIYQSL